jgi:hypothetical protein
MQYLLRLESLLEKEASKHVDEMSLCLLDTNELTDKVIQQFAKSDFKAGAKSKYLNAMIICAQIDILQEFNTTLGIVDRIDKLKGELEILLS